MLKRLFDIVVAALLLIVSSPLMLVIAIAIQIDSRGAVFYRGVRAGRNGKPFRIFKFRTMVRDAENVGGGTTALNDPRVTRVGRHLRRVKLDEIPQLINVLMGEMSMVGPRPELLQYTAQYDADERQILNVRPGITDYSSIEFSSLDSVVGDANADRIYEERVLPRKNQLRLQYAREHTLWGDVKILFITVYRVLGKVIAR